MLSRVAPTQPTSEVVLPRQTAPGPSAGVGQPSSRLRLVRTADQAAFLGLRVLRVAVCVVGAGCCGCVLWVDGGVGEVVVMVRGWKSLTVIS